LDAPAAVAVTSLLHLIRGVGVLLLLRWARWLTLILGGIAVVTGIAAIGFAALATLLDSGQGFVRSWWVFQALNIASNGVGLWYFLRPSVKAQFVKPREKR
jgi:hypothetical protein